MHGGFGNGDAAADALRDAVVGTKPAHKRAGGSRRTIVANVSDADMAQIRKHAERGGYTSLSEYVRSVALAPQAKYDTDQARLAKPLADLSYRIARALDVLERGEADAVHGYLAEMRTIVAGAFSALRKEHDAQVRERA